MQIPCPHCGPRDRAEFTYGGDATKARPPLDAPVADWCDYLYARDNPAGRHAEFWHHTAGCRAVLVVERDTRTHTIHAARFAAGAAAPAARHVAPVPAQ